MYTYKEDKMGNRTIIKTVGENSYVCFPDNAVDNTDYQAYLKWLEEGNTPEPAEGAQQ